MKQSDILFSVIAIAVMASGCSPPLKAVAKPSAVGASDKVRVNFGRKDEPDDFKSICRSEFATSPPLFAMFDFTVEHGGYTCHSGNNDILFVPQRDGRCPQVEASPAPMQVISVEQASEEYTSCAAFGQIGATTPTGVITFEPRSSGPEGSDPAFRTLGYNLIALSGHDALPITSLSWSGDVICIETSNPTVALQRIIESEVAAPSVYKSIVQTGTCRDIGAQLTGSSWPY